jgi:zinc transport system permease protein
MDYLSTLLEYAFLRNAFLAATLAGIACGLSGSYVVSRRLVFLSGGISHASFGGIGLAFFLGMHPPLGAMAFAVLSAVLVQYLGARHGVRKDSAIGVIWSLGMATGIIFVYLTPGYVPNLMSYLFGNILTVNQTDLWLMGGAGVLNVLAFVLFYPLVLSLAFDENYARVRQLPVSVFNYLLMALVAITIVTTIRIAGVILVISFLTLPQAIAGIFTRSLAGMMRWSVILAVLGSYAGIIVSYHLDIPSGASIIFTFALMFLLIRLLFMLRKFSIRIRAKEQIQS